MVLRAIARILVVVTFVSFGVEAAETFVRGDVDGSGFVDMDDHDYFKQWNKGRGPAPVCYDAADLDDDGIITSVDLNYLKTYAR